VIINKKIILFIIIIALGILGWSYFLNPETTDTGNGNSFIFDCPSGVEIKISYDKESDSASLFIDGEEYKIHPVISASGARYANDDESVIFWEHQGEAIVEMNGETAYEGCRLKE